ncbi:Tg [Symbiodinium sp. CCMP2592]|nr:Tg [Symbiodinium sp. CCMP2592]
MILVMALLGFLRAIVHHFRKRCPCGIVLCHHKGGAGSLCRLMKLVIARHSPTRVFLDCDQLENLDYLFEIVRTETKSVVVVLDGEAPFTILVEIAKLRLERPKRGSAPCGRGRGESSHAQLQEWCQSTALPCRNCRDTAALHTRCR